MNKITLIIASRNAHKAQEIAAILPDIYEVRTLADYPQAPDVEENGQTFAANAQLKAEGVSAVLAGLVLADDSGLCVDALGGAPGILSARFAGKHGDDAANNSKLLNELALRPEQAPHTARFVCAMSLAENGRQIAAFEGKVEGRITQTPRGAHGFGYDPIFMPHGYTCTMAELSAADKNAISHRAAALKQLAEFFAQQA